MSKGKSSTVASSDASKGDEKKTAVDFGLLEEDDEFEEFPTETWTEKQEDEEDVNVWEDNWDDDDVEDDFSQKLRAELEKSAKTNSTGDNKMDMS